MIHLLLFVCVLSGFAKGVSFVQMESYKLKGVSDISGVVPIHDSLVLLSSDEGSEIYKWDRKSLKKIFSKDIESDFEAGVRWKNRSIFMGSHGRNKKGKIKKARQVFAFKSNRDDNWKLYGGFLNEFTNVENWVSPVESLSERELLLNSIGNRFLKNKDLAPKKYGLNGEGLSVSPFSKDALLMGFRNPLNESKEALAVEFEPVFEKEEWLGNKNFMIHAFDLKGLSIRDLYLKGDALWILAGPVGASEKKARFKVYHFSKGRGLELALELPYLKNENPEVLWWSGGLLWIARDCGAERKASGEEFFRIETYKKSPSE